MSSEQSIDLDAYLSHINYDGPSDISPTLETLERLQLCHACSIPFENLDILLNRSPVLDMLSIQRKLIADRRGGYCFEQNGLMIEVLKTLGFEVHSRSARVRVSVPRETIPTRTHLFARVMIDGTPYAVDVGVGGRTPTTPIRMDRCEAQQTEHDMRRFDHEESTGRWFHQMQMGDDWVDVYDFTEESMPTIDRKVGNWWTSTSPESNFRKNLMAAIANKDGTRHSISNRIYTHRKQAETLEQIEIESSQHLLALLDQHFGLRFSEGTTFGIEGL